MKNFEYMFSQRILERGIDYYCSTFVETLEKTDKGYHATVHGSFEYDVDIVMDGDDVKEMYCNCPYASSRLYCKHMAATMFRIKYGQPVLKIHEDKINADILNLPDYLSNEAMAPFYSLGLLEDDFEEDDGEISWRTGMDYADAFCDELDGIIGSLISDKKYMTAFHALKWAYYVLNDAPLNGSFGEHAQIADEIEGYWQRLIDLVSDEERDEMFAWFDSMEDDSRYLISSDSIENTLNKAFKDDKYRQARLKKLARYKTEQESYEGEREYKEKKYLELCDLYGLSIE